MYEDEPSFPEPFGADYHAPSPIDCPNCDCCTTRLCTQATEGGVHCTVVVSGLAIRYVEVCPCTQGLPGYGTDLSGTAWYRAKQALSTPEEHQ